MYVWCVVYVYIYKYTWEDGEAHQGVVAGEVAIRAREIGDRALSVEVFIYLMRDLFHDLWREPRE